MRAGKPKRRAGVSVNDERLTNKCKGDVVVSDKNLWDGLWLSVFICLPCRIRCISSERVEASFWWHFLSVINPDGNRSI